METTKKGVLLLILASCLWLSHAVKVDPQNNTIGSESGEVFYGYELTGLQQNKNEIQGNLSLKAPFLYYLKSENSLYASLQFKVSLLRKDELTILIKPTGSKRYHLPNRAPYPNDKARLVYNKTLDYDVLIESENYFSLTIQRKSTKEVIFTTKGEPLIFSHDLIMFTTLIPSKIIFGLGERNYKMKLDDGIYTIFTADKPGKIQTGEKGGQTYGHQPFYLCREQSGMFHAVLVRTTSPMDIELKFPKLTFNLIRGFIEVKLFLGEKDPENLLQEYHTYLGGWNLNSFWTFGFQQSRFGYHKLSDLVGVYDSFSARNLPLDVLWTDIDYMEDYRIFTVDEKRYPVDAFRKFLNESGLKYILIIDPGVAIDEYEGYNEAEKRNVLLKDANGDNFVGKVWPGWTSFVDWLHPNSSNYWTNMLLKLHMKIPYDGIWLDMNEVSNFCDGPCRDDMIEEVYLQMPDEDAKSSNNKTAPVPLKKGKRRLKDIKHLKKAQAETKTRTVAYVPGGGKTIDDKAIAHDAVHYGGIKEIDFHPLHAYYMCKVTNNFLQLNLGHKFPFILTRSTIFGTNKYASHWSGDNDARWQWLKLSISHMVTFNMFGIPFVGSDICGFLHDTSEGLCARWMQLGSLYPFSRNHNDMNAKAQEPYALGRTVLRASLNSLRLRYSILKHYYTKFIAQRGRGTIVKPLFFNFPNDEETFKDNVLDTQFMIGKELMAAPIVEPGVTERKIYFPAGSWFALPSNFKTSVNVQNGTYVEFKCSMEAEPPLFLRGGYLILQNKVPLDRTFKTSDLDNNMILKAALKKTQNGYSAKGEFAAVSNYSSDDEIYSSCVESQCMVKILAEVSVVNNKAVLDLTFTPVSGKPMQGVVFNIEEVVLLGLPIKNTVIASSFNYGSILNDALPDDGFRLKNRRFAVNVPMKKRFDLFDSIRIE
eukprot:TRINITY_DN2230_c0_g3_i2.p1 TRINITY_DN2230_c0_g3~~TRINITY_DN2230_c0_g3_i2.p1  ORF type:complete len:930 (-),score=208.45 TRINITY_DN2230_c0_g3_i2:217-3006(-)